MPRDHSRLAGDRATLPQGIRRSGPAKAQKGALCRQHQTAVDNIVNFNLAPLNFFDGAPMAQTRSISTAPSLGLPYRVRAWRKVLAPLLLPDGATTAHMLLLSAGKPGR